MLRELDRYLAYRSNETRFKETPYLSDTVTNVILVFRGAFNPPHRGHLAVLEQAFRQLKDELNIVAAIVLLGFDQACTSKYKKRGEECQLLSEAKRKRLWIEDSHFPPWAWVCGVADFDEMSVTLERRALRDGCRIRWAYLYGPDNVRPIKNSVACEKEITIVSDVGRTATWDEKPELKFFSSAGFDRWRSYQWSNGQRKYLQLTTGQEHPNSATCRIIKKHDVADETSTNGTLSQNSTSTVLTGYLNESAQYHADDSLSSLLDRLWYHSPVNFCWIKKPNIWRSLRFLRSTKGKKAETKQLCRPYDREKAQDVRYAVCVWQLSS